MGKTPLAGSSVIYVFDDVCKHSLPSRLLSSINISKSVQNDIDIVLAINLKKCPIAIDSVSNLVSIADISSISSKRTLWYDSFEHHLIQSQHRVVRFHFVEDVMRHMNIQAAFYVEERNLLFGPIHALEPLLHSFKLAAIPYTANQGKSQTGLLWISSVKSIRELNDYLMDILIGKIADDLVRKGREIPKILNAFSTNITEELPPRTFRHNLLPLYATWLRRFACCIQNGTFPDGTGLGVRENSINAMTLLAHYQHLFPDRMKYLPIVPFHQDMPRMRSFFDLKYYGCGGSRVGDWYLDWIWDSGSWGRSLSAPSTSFVTKDFQNIDIIAHAISIGGCSAHWSCQNMTTFWAQNFHNCSKFDHLVPINQSVGVAFTSLRNCIKLPVVSCKKVKEKNRIFPLMNVVLEDSPSLQPCEC
jgi:hypothetical protein